MHPESRTAARLRSGPLHLLFALLVLLGATTPESFAHAVADDDKAFIERSAGAQIVPFIYLGAKHMVTGYDHLLFLVGADTRKGDTLDGSAACQGYSVDTYKEVYGANSNGPDAQLHAHCAGAYNFSRLRFLATCGFGL